MTDREQFEAWATAWIEEDCPSLKSDLLEREGETYSHAMQRVQWKTWQAAKATAPQWHDAPTVPGVWLCDEGDICYTWTAHNIEILDQFDPGDGLRWYGPIPEDKQ